MTTPGLDGGLPEPQWLGVLPYQWALQLQRQRRRAVIDGRAPEAFWLVEHPPVITLGRRGGQLRDVPGGVEVVSVERGGLATVHLPGQLVGYPIVDLGGRGGSVRRMVHAIEEGLIGWLADHQIDAARWPGRPGVWVEGAKIAAVGLHFRRGVSLHGFALNLAPDLDAFDWVVPCGHRDARTTSVQALRGDAPRPWQAAAGVGRAVRAAVVDTLAPRG